MSYHQLTSEERHTLSVLRMQGCSQAEIGRQLGRNRSTICRELGRNSAYWDGYYRPTKAIERTNGRRSRSRRNLHFGAEEMKIVEEHLREDWSPEQVSQRLHAAGTLSISHETIYRYVRRDKDEGGNLHRHLRCARKKRRKRYRSYDSRGRLAGKRHISERPLSVESRKEVGHWEIDTVGGAQGKECIVTLVERKWGEAIIGKLEDRTMEETNRRVIALLQKHPGRFKTITADNGTEFHGYQQIEQATGVPFYFATPYHSWERGSNENLNGLIRQYLPKRIKMTGLTQYDCNRIAKKLNTRPRKRLGYRTPEECVNGLRKVPLP